MSKLHIFSALLMFTLMTFQVQNVQGADKSKNLLLEKSFSTSSGDRLVVKGCYGNVVVNTWLNNEIGVRIFGNSEARECLDFNVIIDESGINICATKKAGTEKAKNLNLRYEISAPRDYIVNILKGGRKTDTEKQNGPVEVSPNDSNLGSGR